MPENAAKYQRQVSGAPVEAKGAVEYKIGDVEFDGFVDGKLMEAKAIPSHFVDQATGEFKPWVSGVYDWVRQARRQRAQSQQHGLTLEWHVSEESVADAFRSLLDAEGITGIVVRHVPGAL